MLHSKKIKSAVAVLLLLVTLSFATISASAAETTLDVEYVKITGNGFVADTLNGVESRYNLSGPTLYCSELIPRYYQEVYGINLSIGSGSVKVLGNSDIYFVQTNTPKQGDILFASASARGKGYNHWALVKDVVVGETITCFEQNWSWNGQAGINRVIPYDGSCYVAYTMVSKSGNLPKAQGVKGIVTASEWALPYVEQAVENKYIPVEVDFQESITRAEFCGIAVAIAQDMGYEMVGETALEQAMDLGLITSNVDGLLNRQETAIIATRLGNLLETLDISVLPLEGVYTDWKEIPVWAVDAVSQMTANGLMSATDGAFLPQSAITYEQAVRLLLATSQPPVLEVPTVEEAPLLCTTAESVKLTGDLLQLAR